MFESERLLFIFLLTNGILKKWFDRGRNIFPGCQNLEMNFDNSEGNTLGVDRQLLIAS